MYESKAQAQNALNQQPFTIECRNRHIIVPCFKRNLLGEVISAKPIGYTYRLKSQAESMVQS